MKKIIYGVCLFLLLCGCSPKTQPAEEQKQPAIVKETDAKREIIHEKTGEQLSVSRGLAAKMISLAFSDSTEIEAMDNEISFTDVTASDWYYPYINAAVAEGLMHGDGEEFRPLEPVSLYEAQVLLNSIDKNNKTRIKVTEDTKNKPISYALWVELYKKALLNIAGDNTVEKEFGIKEEELYIFATPGNSLSLSPWNMVTDKGIYTFFGYAMDAYADKRIKVTVKGNEIVTVAEILEENPVVEGVYIKDFQDQKAVIFMGGQERAFHYAGKEPLTLPAIATVKINDTVLQSLQVWDSPFSDTIKMTDETVIALEEKGPLPHINAVQVYNELGELCQKKLSDLICGTDIADYYVNKEGNIVAAVIRRSAQPEKIRVVLSNDHGSYLHQQIAITCSGPITIHKIGSSEKIPAQTPIPLDTLENGQRAILQPEQNNSIFTIASLQKNGNIPCYRGVMEVEKREDNFILVNEVPLEEYLYSVVPSEMPSSYGLEAAKVQAVTARSYAYNQFFANRFHTYGANVDDTTLCQVYNTVPENETSITAVDSTKGLCVTYNGEIVSANFYSTSAGVGANNGEVWAGGGNVKKFPSWTPPYLESTKHYTGTDYGDLSKEENAARFFKETTINSFDWQFGWFRWNITMSGQELSAIINHNLSQVYTQNNSLVKTLQSNGTYKSRPIDTIGTVKSISVQKRGEGGNVMELIIKGDQAEILVYTEYAVRSLLAPVQQIAGQPPIRIKCHNGNIISNYGILPSGFFVIDQITEQGVLQSATFYGGGNGHGVGMSQNGVKGMIEEGYTFEEILKHYYTGTEIKESISYNS